MQIKLNSLKIEVIKKKNSQIVSQPGNQPSMEASIYGASISLPDRTFAVAILAQATFCFA